MDTIIKWATVPASLGDDDDDDLVTVVDARRRDTMNISDIVD